MSSSLLTSPSKVGTAAWVFDFSKNPNRFLSNLLIGRTKMNIRFFAKLSSIFNISSQ